MQLHSYLLHRLAQWWVAALVCEPVWGAVEVHSVRTDYVVDGIVALVAYYGVVGVVAGGEEDVDADGPRHGGEQQHEAVHFYWFDEQDLARLGGHLDESSGALT